MTQQLSQSLGNWHA